MTRPIRVLELRSVAGTGGGPDKTLLASAQLRNPDVALTLCYLCNAGDDVFGIGDQAQALGIDYVEIRERGSLDVAAWRSARALIRERGIDIVHGHEYKTDLLAYLLAKAEDVIPFATAHGWTGRSWKERWIYYPADKRILARFPRVAAVSSEIKRTLVTAGGAPHRIDVVLNGIDATRFRRDPAQVPAARRSLGAVDGEILIGSVGRLETQKRFDLLIDAFASLASDFPSARLVIAGDGSLRQPLEARAMATGLGRRIQLVGHTDVLPFHHALDLFVQSSEYEGTPNVVLEAMAMETPLLATDVGGTAELAQDGVHGLIVPTGSARALADAMREALTDPAGAKHRVLAARARVETELSFERRMARMNAIYDELIDTARMRRTV